MSSEWKTYSVDELVAQKVLAPPLDGNHGAIHPKSSDFVSTGIPFIMASDMRDGLVDTTHCAFITEQQAATLRKGFAKPGDVLLSHKATIGRTALVGEIETAYLVLTPQVTYYRVLDDKRLNNRYLKYYFDSASFQKTLGAWAGAGSTRAYLGITAQRKLPIVLPPIDLQNEIASIAGSLDDRITLLRQTNATLEAIAQALFKSWFVNFEPVRAKMEGRSPEGMDEATAGLFPDSFEETELGAVPKGWTVGKLAGLMRLHKGSVNPGAQPDVEFQHFSLPAFDAGQMPVQELGGAIKSNKTTVPEDAVLVSKLNPHIPRVWLPSTVGQNAVCSTEFLPFVPVGPSTTAFVYSLLVAPDFSKALSQLVTGTSNSHQRVKPDGVLAMPGVIPPVDVVCVFDVVANELLGRLKINRQQAQTLATLRDTLLPRLISGQLRLPEAQELVEEFA